ncbi:DNA methylase N-4/N-6 domain-containing protein [Caballeronia calidae]|uniref:DNA methylase N-4/N-6 domain-containing protein n=3 Tax=Caballeronia calidae TaxID=1777139 RepID=A0A158E8A7_9BURK|nr:ParB/Srx family N-terminal domain-containing protein [Caballeronia calidae]SAL03131.1 DNA methylase N-4/N-6 domain-containing protein [Caballeronia calidae]
MGRRTAATQEPETPEPAADAPESRRTSPWPATNIERRPLGLLVPYARNARLHSDAQISQIMASMREWGWTQPILVSENDTIIAGHGRVMAGLRLGLGEAPVMVARGWSDSKIRAYVIADNRLAENASWDREMLGSELSELRDAFDLSLTGFTTGEIDAMTVTDLPELGVAYDERAAEQVKFIKCPECGHEFPR